MTTSELIQFLSSRPPEEEVHVEIEFSDVTYGGALDYPAVALTRGAPDITILTASREEETSR